mgnify:FL=1
MPEWSDEIKASVVKKYLDAKPTPETSTQIIENIAEALGDSYTVNGVRIILVKSKNEDGSSVYVKKDSNTTTKTDGTKSTRVNKTEAINGLKDLIEGAGLEIDEDIIGKMTGKAAVYFTSVITAINEKD